MKKHLLIILTTTIFTISCSTTTVMTDDQYKELSIFPGGLQKCFENEKISPQLYAETKNSLSHILSTLTMTYDTNKMSSMIKQAYSETKGTTGDCRQIEAYAHQMNSLVSERKQDQKDNEKAANEARKERNTNKPIYCNKIGTMTICN